MVELEISLQIAGKLNLSVPCDPNAGQSISYAVNTFKELVSLEFLDYSQGDSNLKVDILVGLDQHCKLVTGEVIRCLVHTKFGWVLSEPVQGSPSPGILPVNLITTHSLRVDAYQQAESELDNHLKMFWDLKSLGVKHDKPSVYEEFQKGKVYKYP